MSVEPVVGTGRQIHMRLEEEDLAEVLMEEYDKLAALRWITVRNRQGRWL